MLRSHFSLVGDIGETSTANIDGALRLPPASDMLLVSVLRLNARAVRVLVAYAIQSARCVR